mmetsp:Transcript_51126/g.165516  ORF Transcript_51126/g.165516 Transcript_51126/m.165516 type:complete len:283 (-) Transcript_51126:437-1285(-)
MTKLALPISATTTSVASWAIPRSVATLTLSPRWQSHRFPLPQPLCEGQYRTAILSVCLPRRPPQRHDEGEAPDSPLSEIGMRVGASPDAKVKLRRPLSCSVPHVAKMLALGMFFTSTPLMLRSLSPMRRPDPLVLRRPRPTFLIVAPMRPESHVMQLSCTKLAQSNSTLFTSKYGLDDCPLLPEALAPIWTLVEITFHRLPSLVAVMTGVSKCSFRSARGFPMRLAGGSASNSLPSALCVCSVRGLPMALAGASASNWLPSSLCVCSVRGLPMALTGGSASN